MARFRQYLNEGKVNDAELLLDWEALSSNFKNKLRTMVKDIKPYLKKIKKLDKNRLLFRGIKDKATDIGIVKTRKDRRAKDSNSFASKIVDDYFEKNFGHRFRSNHVVFTINDRTLAGVFGKIHIVFPIGKFKFLWSATVRDMTTKFNLISADPRDFSDSKEKQLLIDLKNAKFKTRNLNKAMDSGREIMINVKEYWVVQEDFIIKGLSNFGDGAVTAFIRLLEMLHNGEIK